MTSVLSFHIQLNSVRISRDNKGVKPGWLLDRITIDVDEKDEHYVFYCNRWIGSSDNAVDFSPGKQTFSVELITRMTHSLIGLQSVLLPLLLYKLM